VAEDVLQHHDRIVHHQPDRQHQRQQRQGVDREPCKCHECKGAHQADRNSDDGNDGCPEGAQEHKNHQSNQHHRFQDGLVHVFDRTVDEHRVVVGYVNRHARWQVGLQLGDHLAHAGRQAQRVGGGLADHAGRDGLAPVQAHGAAFVGSGFLHARHVADLDRETVHTFDGDVAELRGAHQVGLRCDAELPLLRLDAPTGHFEVAAADGVFHVLRGQAVGRQARGVEPDPHGVFAFTKDTHVGHTSHRLQPGFNHPVHHVVDLQRSHGVAGERQPDHRKRIGLDLGDHGLVDGLGQAVAHA